MDSEIGSTSKAAFGGHVGQRKAGPVALETEVTTSIPLKGACLLFPRRLGWVISRGASRHLSTPAIALPPAYLAEDTASTSKACNTLLLTAFRRRVVTQHPQQGRSKARTGISSPEPLLPDLGPLSTLPTPTPCPSNPPSNSGPKAAPGVKGLPIHAHRLVPPGHDAPYQPQLYDPGPLFGTRERQATSIRGGHGLNLLSEYPSSPDHIIYTKIRTRSCADHAAFDL